jgi:2-succinyl-5-enolpyruvyl-6-hydroxy-3-cyclohexene-1-carboxylate synthase
LTAVLEKYPLSEPAWVRRLSHELPQGARFFIGNSLPIREWDLAAAARSDVEVFANRGVNGIDGLISTFLGVSEANRSNWALIGDLSALYDLSGPWALRSHSVRDVNLVVLNNGGGKIFERMFHNSLFENRHDLNLQSWTKLWDWDYLAVNTAAEWPRCSRPRVIEIFPSAEETAAFWREWSAE